MSGELYGLDANVFFYAIDNREPARQRKAADLVERLATGFDVIVPLQAFCEFFAAATRKGRMEPLEAAALVADWQTLFATAYPGAGTFDRASRAVVDHSLSFWDAMLWAVAEEAGVSVLLSEDFQHGRCWGGPDSRTRSPKTIHSSSADPMSSSASYPSPSPSNASTPPRASSPASAPGSR